MSKLKVVTFDLKSGTWYVDVNAIRKMHKKGLRKPALKIAFYTLKKAYDVFLEEDYHASKPQNSDTFIYQQLGKIVR